MQPQEIMQAQIDSALAGLTRIREHLAGAGTTDGHLIGHELEWAASHLEDIRHIWASLKFCAISRVPGRSSRVADISAIGPPATGS